MRTRSCTCLALALSVLLAGGTFNAGAYTQTATAEGLKIRWGNGSVIRYSFNQNFAPNPPNNNDLVRAAVGDAFRTLVASTPLVGGTPAVRFEEAAATSVNKSGPDCVNMITFTDTDSADQLPEGVIAAAQTFFSDQSGTACGFQFTPGQIVDADMLFNATRRFSASQQVAGTFDIQSIALHEGGHWLGLNHTGILAAAMSPFGDSGEFPARVLHTDDIASLRAIYGASGATISGRITTTAGANVKGAHVMATDNATGLSTASFVTGDDGTYRIGGLPAGTYRVFAEPLDGPARLSNMPQNFQSGGNTSFVTTFFPSTVSVTTGEAANNNIQVATPLAMNLDTVGISLGPGIEFQIGGLPKSIRRGTDAAIFLGGASLSGEVRLSSPRITLRGPLRTQGTFQIADVRLTADTSLGPTDIYFGSTSFTGGLIVTVNPVVFSGGIVDAAAFNQNTTAPHYAPGSMISIFGADLALPGDFFAERVPLPTQMGGITVLVGDRLAPLYFVRGGANSQINAMIPFEITGTSVSVKVVAGNQSESAAVSLTMGSSAPRIFVVPNTQGNGAILNGSKANILVAANNPASVNDVLVFFLTGLGAVSPSLATGLASAGERTVATVSVSIGGRPATVQFAGLAPGFVGLYQVNAVVPSGASGRVPVVISTSAGSSNQAFTFVQ